MDGEDEDGGLFNIEVDSDEERRVKEQEKKVPRDFQSEEDFQSQLENWRPKVENGEIWKSLTLPLDNPSKLESQTILHAIEELYFLKRYEEALAIVGKTLEGKLAEEFRVIVVKYEGMCQAKVEKRKMEMETK